MKQLKCTPLTILKQAVRQSRPMIGQPAKTLGYKYPSINNNSTIWCNPLAALWLERARERKLATAKVIQVGRTPSRPSHRHRTQDKLSTAEKIK